MNSFSIRSPFDCLPTNADDLRRTAYFKGTADSPARSTYKSVQPKPILIKQPPKLKPPKLIKCPVLAAKYLPKGFFNATPSQKITIKNPNIKRIFTANDKSNSKFPPAQLRIKRLAPLSNKTGTKHLYRKTARDLINNSQEESLLSYSEFVPIPDYQRLFTSDSSSNKKEEKKKLRKILSNGVKPGMNLEKFTSYRQITSNEPKEDVTFCPLESAEEVAISNASTSGSQDSLKINREKRLLESRKIIRSAKIKSPYIANI